MRAIPLLVTIVLVVVPGLGAAMAAYRPGGVGAATRFALVFAFGYAVTGGVAFLLAVAGVLSLAVFVAVLVAVTATLWIVALRRGSPREHARAVAEEAREDPWGLGLGLLVVLSIGVAALFISPLVSIPGVIPFRYWADGLEVASAGRIPHHSLMYGTVYASATSKSFLNAFDAAVIRSTGVEALGPIAAVLWVSTVGIVSGLWALGRELGLRLTAPLLPLLVVWNRVFLSEEMTRDMNRFKAETVGRVVAVGVLVLGVRVLRHARGWKDTVLAGVLAGAAAGTHLVPLLVAVLFLGWYASARLLLGPDRGAVLARAGAIAGVAAVAGFAVLFLPGGDVGFRGARTAGYEGFEPGFDPTLYLYTGQVDQPLRRGPWYVPPRDVYRSFVERAVAQTEAFHQVIPGRAAAPVPRIVFFVLPPLALLLAVVIALRFPDPLRPIGVTAVGLAGTLVLLAMAFSWRYEVFVTATFGIRRLFDYGSLTIILLGLTVIEAGLWIAARRRRWLLGAGATALTVGLGALLVPTALPPPALASIGGRALDPLTWIRANVPCDGRIISNERAVGVYRVMTGRVALLEGMGPFLRPDMLRDLIGLLFEARRFYAEPRNGRAFLARRGIDYVFLLKGRLGFGKPNPPLVGRLGVEIHPAEFRRTSFLRLAYSTPKLDVYRVVDIEAAGAFPDPADYPGYRCLTRPITAGTEPGPPGTHPG